MIDQLTALLRRTAMATVALMVGCAVFAAAPLYAQVTDTTQQAMPTDTTGIVQVLQEQGNYTQLADALQRTGLDQALAQEQAFTLFAPTDSAFAQMETPIEQMDEQQLTDVLRYHVAFEQLPSDQLAQVTEIQMGNGQTVQVTSQQAGAPTDTAQVDTAQVGGMQQPGQAQTQIGGAHGVQADLQAQNGVIHGIDQVLMPQQVGAE